MVTIHFNQQILYTYNFNFIEHFDSVYRRGNLEESKEYLALVQKSFAPTPAPQSIYNLAHLLLKPQI